MTVSPPELQIASFQSHGAVVVLGAEDLKVRHASANTADLFGRPADELVGHTLDDLVDEQDARGLAAVLSGRPARLGWQRVLLAGGGHAKIRGFEPADGLVGLDIVPVGADAHTSGAQAMERVTQWSEQILGTTDVVTLMRLAASTVNELSGFEGTWACRIEPEGHGVVVGAVASGTSDVEGQLVLPTDMPPDQPRVQGRTLPFFVADLTDRPVALVPPPPVTADFDGSSLRRPFETYLQRLFAIGVEATLSIPIVVEGRLWGRLIAHHPRPLKIPPAAQAELRLLGAATSTHLAELLELQSTRERLDAAIWSSRILESIADAGDLLDGLVADPQALLGLCHATSALVSIDGRDAFAGEPLVDYERRRVLTLARAQLDRQGELPLPTPVAVSQLAPDPDLPSVGGFLAVSLGSDAANLVVWVRPARRGAVTWVNHHPVDGDSSDHLFEAMTARVDEYGASVPWSATQIQAATDFHAAVASLIMTRYQQVARLNDQLARSNEEFDAFSHAASHDLKQPIRSISQYTEFFLEDVAHKLTDDEQDQLRTVLRLADRMTGLLDDLMRYAELGESMWRPETIDVRAAVDEALELLPPRMVQPAAFDVQEARIQADPAAVRQLLLNLIGNALKYSDGRPQVTVGVMKIEEAAAQAVPPVSLSHLPPEAPVLFVRDRGIGIDPKYQPLVFELFRKFNADSAGSGAGLAICRRIARRCGGDIWLHSEPGGGSTFFVAVSQEAVGVTHL